MISRRHQRDRELMQYTVAAVLTNIDRMLLRGRHRHRIIIGAALLLQ